jgi:hypothetical protein
MTLALRRTVFFDGETRPDHYEVRHDGQTVGRIYRLRSTDGSCGDGHRAGWRNRRAA